MKEIRVEALDDNLYIVLNFLEEGLDSIGCNNQTKSKIALVAEEIYINIAHYAYTEEGGMALVSYDLEDDPLSITIIFSDSGVPYNPLEKPDPDTTLSANERQIGGLGIFLVKKIMDSVEYAYVNGNNVLTIKKKLS